MMKNYFNDYMLFCGLGNGILQINHCYYEYTSKENSAIKKIYEYGDRTKEREMKLNFVQKMQIHQNGINEICVKKMGKLLNVYTCGDDQSIHILVLKIKKKNRNIHICILQSSNFTNAHLSSIRSLKFIFPFLFTVSWDQYISIWKFCKRKKSEKSKNQCKNEWVMLEKKGQIKIAVYDVCCLNVFKYKKRKKKKGNHQIVDLKIENKKNDTSHKFDVGVSGANGSLELFRIKIIE